MPVSLFINQPSVTYRSQSSNYKISVFVLGDDEKLKERTLDTTNSNNPQWFWVDHGNGGLDLVAGPSAIYLPGESVSVRVMCLDRGGALRERYLTESQWAWRLVGSPGIDLVTRPEALFKSLDEFKASAFVIAKDGGMWEYHLHPQQGWLPVQLGHSDSGGPIYSGPASIYRNRNTDSYRMSVFSASWSNKLLEWSYSSAQESGWHDHEHGSSPVVSRPSAVYTSQEQDPVWMRVYVVGADGNLYENKFDSGKWSWVSLGSSADTNVFAAPSAVDRKAVGASQVMSVFTLTSMGDLAEATLNEQWSWTHHGNNGAVLSSEPAVIAFPSGTFTDNTLVRVFVVDTTGTLQDRYLTPEGWSWYSHGQPPS